jgi:hypothetical protein
VLAALIALAALFGGNFDETDGEILATLGLVVLAGGVTLAGLGLHEQDKATPVGEVALVAAPVCALLLLLDIWSGFDGGNLGRWAGTAIIVLFTLGVISSSLLLYRNPAFLWLVWGEGAALTLAASITVALIWERHAGDGSWKAAVACWIIAILGWVLVPVLQRSSAAATTPPSTASGAERVVATLADVDLVVTTEPRQDDLLVPGVMQLFPGEQVALRLRQP